MLTPIKSLHQRRIEYFMKGAGQEVPDSPTVPSEEVRLLRAKLILEEALETVRAMGIEPVLCNQHGTADPIHVECIDYDVQPDNIYIEDVIDGCCDISVVTIGTLSAFGVPDEVFIEEVDASNILKIKNGYKRHDGKWMKGSDWKPPRIAEILDQMWPDILTRNGE